jgi:hypothetical protein
MSSTILSSFFIEPIVRQARRFSIRQQNKNPPQETTIEDAVGEDAQRLREEEEKNKKASSAGSTASSHAIVATATASEQPLEEPGQYYYSTTPTASASASRSYFDSNSDFFDSLATPTAVQCCSSTPLSKAHCYSPPPGNHGLPDHPAAPIFSHSAPLTLPITCPGASSNPLELRGTCISTSSSNISNMEPSATSPNNNALVDSASPHQPGAGSPSTPTRSTSATINSNSSSLPDSPTRPRSGLPIRTRRTSTRRTSADNAFRSASLPADDGKSLLRQRIHAIRELQASNDEKARQMHNLMNEAWHNARVYLRPTSPESVQTPERPCSSSSLMSMDWTNPTTPGSPPSFAPPFDLLNPYNVFAPDLLPCYRPSSSDSPEEPPTSPDDESGPPEPDFGCVHYKRNVKVQCYDCKLWYPCRHCHDEAQTNHALNRHATENMLCMMCQTPQPAAQTCRECSMRAAWYYCDTCKLWEDDGSKRVYHCADCGICRRGEGLGKDFTHCKVTSYYGHYDPAN